MIAGSNPARVVFFFMLYETKSACYGIDPVAEWIRHWILLAGAALWVGAGGDEPRTAGSNPARVVFFFILYKTKSACDGIDPGAKWIRHWILLAGAGPRASRWRLTNQGLHVRTLPESLLFV